MKKTRTFGCPGGRRKGEFFKERLIDCREVWGDKGNMALSEFSNKEVLGLLGKHVSSATVGPAASRQLMKR